jgi:hypothetical protein
VFICAGFYRFLNELKKASSMFHDLLIVSRFSDQRFNAATGLHKPWFQSTAPLRLPPWLAPPDVAKPLLPHKYIMSNFHTLPYVRAG